MSFELVWGFVTDRRVFAVGVVVAFDVVEDFETSVSGVLEAAVLEHFESPLETLVKDPQQLLGSRQRLDALVAGLRLVERDPSRFEKLARALPAAPR